MYRTIAQKRSLVGIASRNGDAKPKLKEGGWYPEVLQMFLEWHHMEGHTVDTRKSYRVQLNMFGAWLAATGRPTILTEITDMDLLSYFNDVKQQGLAPRTMKTKVVVLKTFFEWCIEWGFVKANPASRFKNPKVPKTRYRFVSDEAFAKMLALCPLNTFLGARRYAMLKLFITSGLRVMELTALKIKDVVTGPHLAMDSNRIVIEMGKGQKAGGVPFSSEAKMPLKRYLMYRRDDYPELWVSEERRPINRNGIREDIARLMVAAGIKGDFQGVCHSLRRTWAANALRQRIPMPYVKALGRWEDDTMLGHYVASMEEETLAALAEFERFR